jgi:hypothetical protein
MRSGYSHSVLFYSTEFLLLVARHNCSVKLSSSALSLDLRCMKCKLRALV